MGVKAKATPRVCRVDKVASASMGYPLSVFNQKLYSQRKLFRCMFDVTFVTHKIMITIPILSVLTPPWYATISNLRVYMLYLGLFLLKL